MQLRSENQFPVKWAWCSVFNITIYQFFIQILQPKRNPCSSNSFHALDCSLDSLGISEMQRESIYGLLASILHLGNIQFGNNDSGYAHISSESYQSLVCAADLLATDSKILENSLLKRKLSVPNNQRDSEVTYVKYIRTTNNVIYIIHSMFLQSTAR